MAIIKPGQLSSGSFSISGSFSGSFFGDGSNLVNIPTQSFETGSFATTSSNTFYGLQTISASTDFSALDIHVKDDGLWTFRTYNDAYSSSSIGLASWIDNNGISFLGTETNRPLYIYNNASYYSPTLIISSSGVEIDNTLTVNDGITGSLFGTASWAENSISSSYVLNAISASYASYAVSASYEINYETSSSYAETASVAVSSSYAQTSSYAPNYLPLTGGTISGTLHQSGTFYPDQIDWFSSSIGYDTGSYILTTTANGLTTYANYQNIADTLTPYISTVSSSISASYADTASYVQNAQTASYVTTAQTASYVSNAVSSSFATSSSYALSASYAPSTVPSGPFGIANTLGVYTYYSTFSASMAAATSGQTVEMFADITETTNISIALKNGVNINGNGHTYTLNQAGTANCIQDGGVAVNCAISNITFKRSGGTGSDVNTLPMYITGASKIKGYSTNLIGDSTNIRCLTINNISAEVYGIYCEGTSPVTITSGALYNSEVRSLLLIGINVATNGRAVKCTGYGFYNGGILSAGTLIDCTAYDPAVGAMSITAGSATNCVGYGGGGPGITLSGTGALVNCTGYGVGGVGITINGGIYAVGCIGYSTVAAGIGMINGVAYDCIGFSTANNGISTTNSGANITELRSCSAISTTAVALNMANTTSGCKIYNTEAYSKWNNAAGHGIVVAGANAEIVQCIIEVTNASANCISGSSALTTKYANNAFKGSTVAVNANITQGIVNTHDNQGNILV